jgi:molybdate transport system ATP-binding protein
VRVRVLASDVSLAREPGLSTIQNLLPAEVEAIVEEGPGSVLVQLRVGEAQLLALVTARALAALAIAPGERLWAQVKSVAVLA